MFKIWLLTFCLVVSNKDANVHLLYNTRNGRNSITAEVILPKLNYVQGSGVLRNTKLELESDNRLTADEVDLMVSESKDLKAVAKRRTG